MLILGRVGPEKEGVGEDVRAPASSPHALMDVFDYANEHIDCPLCEAYLAVIGALQMEDCWDVLYPYLGDCDALEERLYDARDALDQRISEKYGVKSMFAAMQPRGKVSKNPGLIPK